VSDIVINVNAVAGSFVDRKTPSSRPSGNASCIATATTTTTTTALLDLMT